MSSPTFLLLWATLCLAAVVRPRVQSRLDEEVIKSLSFPGVQFRHAQPMKTPVTSFEVQNYLKIKRVPPSAPGLQGSGHRSARSRYQHAFNTAEDGNHGGFDNATSIDHFAAQYSVEVSFNGQPMQLVIDSGGADTWARAGNFSCFGKANETRPQEACWLGPSYHGGFSEPVDGQHFTIKYNDGETIAGPMGYANIEVAGIEVSQQQIALATQGMWFGDNITSGVLGLAYPSLTSAYWGTDLDDDSEYLSVLYSPLFSTMISEGLTQPFWCLALNRNSSDGMISFGGLPPVDLSHSHVVASTPILIADIAHKSTSAWQPSYYTIVPDGFHHGQVVSKGQYPFILDTGTTLSYLPPDIANSVNAQFTPPAQYMRHYDGYFTKCDAIPPRFGIKIGGAVFWVNPQDMINREMRDPVTGLCPTGIASGGSKGPYVLGLSFLTNVMVIMNVGEGTVQFHSREFYR